jgi:hypothetical protein
VNSNGASPKFENYNSINKKTKKDWVVPNSRQLFKKNMRPLVSEAHDRPGSHSAIAIAGGHARAHRLSLDMLERSR